MQSCNDKRSSTCRGNFKSFALCRCIRVKADEESSSLNCRTRCQLSFASLYEINGCYFKEVEWNLHQLHVPSPYGKEYSRYATYWWHFDNFGKNASAQFSYSREFTSICRLPLFLYVHFWNHFWQFLVMLYFIEFFLPQLQAGG